MPRRYKIIEMKGETIQDRIAKGYAVQIPLDDERIFPPVVYRCSRCYGRFYTLSKFAEHLTMKHGIPYSQVWRFVQGAEIR
jgi:hypothetical protein